MPNRATISFGRFCALRSGDLVVWRGKYLRTVQKGPADDVRRRPRTGGLACVEFTIRTRSWRNRIDTTYNYNDLRSVIRPASARVRGLMLKSEYAKLAELGFDVRRELVRELEMAERQAKHLGRPLCRAHPRLSRLIRGEERRD